MLFFFLIFVLLFIQENTLHQVLMVRIFVLFLLFFFFLKLIEGAMACLSLQELMIFLLLC